MKNIIILLVLVTNILFASLSTQTIIIDKSRLKECPLMTIFHSSMVASVVKKNQIIESESYKLCNSKNMILLEVRKENKSTRIKTH